MPGSTRVNTLQRQHGFTRWAVLVALVIIGLLALAVGPRLFGDVALTEISTAKTQVATLGEAIERFHQDTGRYPTDSEGLEALVTQPAGETKWKGPVQTGDIVYISNRGHGLQANTHDQEGTDHALEPRVPSRPSVASDHPLW